MHPLPDLNFLRLRLHFTAPKASRVLHFAGSAWRGALGHELRRIACLTGANECEGCPLLLQCDYSYLFATPVPPDADMLANYQEAPHPYVLFEHSTDPTHITLELTLVGRAQHRLAIMLHALHRAAQGAQGIGGRILKLEHIEQWQAQDDTWHSIRHHDGSLHPLPTAALIPPPCPESDIKIELQSPLRLRRQGQHVRPHDFAFADVFNNLLRRISLLNSFHGDAPYTPDYRSLTQAARDVPLLSADLHWIEQKRHSHRQQSDMSLGGLMGQFSLAPRDFALFWPYLWLGQYTHVGRATSMGLGRYRIYPASLPSTPRPA